MRSQILRIAGPRISKTKLLSIRTTRNNTIAMNPQRTDNQGWTDRHDRLNKAHQKYQIHTPLSRLNLNLRSSVGGILRRTGTRTPANILRACSLLHNVLGCFPSSLHLRRKSKIVNSISLPQEISPEKAKKKENTDSF